MAEVTERKGALQLALEKNAKTQPKKKAGGYGGGDQGSSNPVSVNGYDKSELTSALQKAIRRGDEVKALYWASEMMASGETYRMWRRLIIMASEDVGLAQPELCSQLMLMKQAHDMGREWNIPFQAVMMLCRAPKNREADDAAYYFEERRKTGWKIPMPPEAVDGHTRIGKSRLYRLSSQTGEDFLTLWCREFYYDAALLKGYVPDESRGTVEEEKDDMWRRALMKFLNLPYETYELADCPQPRLLTGTASKDQTEAEMAHLAKRIPNSPTIRQVDENGEPLGSGEMMVESFTEDGKWYRVSVNDETCTCIAFERSGPGALCKHILAAMRWTPEEK